MQVHGGGVSACDRHGGLYPRLITGSLGGKGVSAGFHRGKRVMPFLVRDHGLPAAIGRHQRHHGAGNRGLGGVGHDSHYTAFPAGEDAACSHQ